MDIDKNVPTNSVRKITLDLILKSYKETVQTFETISVKFNALRDYTRRKKLKKLR
jgi:hypothetical protein